MARPNPKSARTALAAAVLLLLAVVFWDAWGANLGAAAASAYLVLITVDAGLFLLWLRLTHRVHAPD